VALISIPNYLALKEEEDTEYPNFAWGVVLALTASILSGFAYLMMRKTGEAVHSAIGPFYFALLAIPTCLPFHWLPIPQVFSPAGPPNSEENALDSWKSFALVTAVGLCGWLA